jgi:hypothetical protein|tara:strand:+ start:474 stop:1058 length:585 start_codon:yes stop_codon:yes gene_type:complete
MGKTKNYYKDLSELPIKRLVEKKGGLDYLSWSNAWDMLKKEYPNAQRLVYESEHTGLNYFSDGKSAYVKVGIIVNDIEHIDYLPVMDYRNKSIGVDKITSFDVSKTIQRATAKAIAMHGLGLSLWTGEDIPSNTQTPAVAPKSYTIDIGDDKWGQVLQYVADNKKAGFEELIKRLSTKYKFTADAKKEIEKSCK